MNSNEAKKSAKDIPSDWRWGTAEGSREFDRLNDRLLEFREKLEWLEEAETLSLRFPINRARAIAEGRLLPPEGSKRETLK